MVDGTYNVMLKTPMGVKKGQLILASDGEALTGKLIALGEENCFTNGSTSGDSFTFSGELKTAMGKVAYECAGSVDDNAISGSVKTKKGTLALTGKRQ